MASRLELGQQGPQQLVKGPVRPGIDEPIFRGGGGSVRQVQGPQQPYGPVQRFPSKVLGKDFGTQEQLRQAEQQHYQGQVKTQQDQAIQQLSRQNQMNLRGIKDLNQRQQFNIQTQSKIAAIKTAGASVVSGWKPEYTEQYYKQSFGDTIKRIVREKSLAPLEQYGSRISEVERDVSSGVLKRGTISPEERPFYTKGELQAQIDISQTAEVERIKGEAYQELSGTAEKLQEDIEAGVITLKEAEKRLEDETKRINIKIEKTPVFDYGEIIRPGKQTGADIKEVIEFGGEAVSLLTAPTSVLVGVKKATEFEKTTPLLLEKDSSLPLYPGYVRKDWTSPLFFAGAGAGGLRGMAQLDRQIVGLELKGLAEQPLVTSTLRAKTPQGFVDIVKGKQTFRGLQRETTAIIPTEAGSGRFVSPGGMAEVRTTGELSWNVIPGRTNYLTSIQEFKIGAFGTYAPIDKKHILTISKSKAIPTESTSVFWVAKPVPFSKFTKPALEKGFVEKKAQETSEALIEGYGVGGEITSDYGLSISRKIKKDKFISRSGKLTDVTLDVGTEQALIGGELTDFGITKIIEPKGKDVKFLRAVGSGKRTPLSKTFADETIQIIQPGTTKLLEKVVKKPTPIPPALIKDTGLSPSYISSGSLVSESQYYGRGGFVEPEFSYISPTTKTDFQFNNLIPKPTTITTSPVLKIDTLLKPETKIIKTDLFLKGDNLLKTDTLIKTDTALRMRQKQTLRPGQSLKTLQKAYQRLQIRQDMRQRIKAKVRIPTKTITPGFVGGWLPGLTKTIPSTKPKDEGLFIPEIRRQKKWIGLGEFESLRKAFGKGRKTTLQTLGASFRVRRGKDILPIRPKTKYFRKSKREAGVLIQKKRAMGMYRGRLSSPTERVEIMMAKRNINFFK